MVLARSLRSIAYSSLLLAVAACQQAQQQQPQITAKTTDDTLTSRSCILSVGWTERMPFHYRAPDGSAFGVDVDVLTYLADKAGCALRYRYVPERQQMERLENGDVDVLVGAYRGLDQPNGLTYSDAYRTETYDLHVISESPVHRDDLGMLIKLDYDLGLTQGYSYEEPVTTLRNDMVHKKQFVLAQDSKVNVENLLTGKVDGILEDELVVRAIADRELVAGRVEHLNIHAGSQSVYLLFNNSKVGTDVITRFNQAITQLKQEGEYDTILGRHI